MNREKQIAIIKARLLCFVFLLLITVVVVIISLITNSHKKKANDIQIIVEPVTTQSNVHESLTEPPTITTEVKAIRNVQELNEEDAYLLSKIAMAEAEGESIECKALVMLTVLNRMRSDKFPDTIHDVIYQKGQFSPITNGRWNKVEPNEDCYKALDMIYSGYDESNGCLYFEACQSKDNWFSRNLQFLFEVDSVRFYK